MANTISNSSVQNSLFTVNGSTINSNNQPGNTKSTVFANLAQTNTTTANSVTLGNPDSDLDETRVRSARPLGSQTTDLASTFSGVVADGVNTRIQYHGGTSPTAYFEVGDIALVNNVGFARVMAVTASGVTVNVDSTASGNIVSTNPLQIVSKSYLNDNRLGSANAVMGYTTQLAGEANAAIQGGATAPNRDINRTESLRTRRVGTAIRAGNYDYLNGTFTTEPSNDNVDYVPLLSGDTVASGIKRITFQFGSNIPTNSAHE